MSLECETGPAVAPRPLAYVKPVAVVQLLVPSASDTASASLLGCLDLPFRSGEEFLVPGAEADPEPEAPIEEKSPNVHLSFFFLSSFPLFFSFPFDFGGFGSTLRADLEGDGTTVPIVVAAANVEIDKRFSLELLSFTSGSGKSVMFCI